MEDEATFDMVDDLVDDDLRDWSSALANTALSFKKQHPNPPEIELMPPVVGPRWNVVADFISSGGLRSHYVQRVATTMSPTKRARLGESTSDTRCYAELNSGDCHRRNCERFQTKKPNHRSSSGMGGGACHASQRGWRSPRRFVGQCYTRRGRTREWRQRPGRKQAREFSGNSTSRGGDSTRN